MSGQYAAFWESAIAACFDSRSEFRSQSIFSPVVKFQ